MPNHFIMRGRGVNYNRCSARIQTTEVRAVTEQTLAVLRAKNRAFRWPKGVSGNPDGQSRHYHACGKLARDASPAMMQELIRLAQHAEDERVRSVCAIAVLDRAGIRPIDKPEPEQEPSDRRWDPTKYSVDERELIRTALRLMLEDRRNMLAHPATSEPEALPPSDENGRE
jgi:hypothetical protein